MKELFFTTTRPRHRYKSEQFFIQFLRMRSHNTFGQLAGRRESFMKKILVLKKFFYWFYQFPSARMFRKVFTKSWGKGRLHLRGCLAFFQMMEQQLAIVLVRLALAFTYADAINQIRSGFVFVNGCQTTLAFYQLKGGDVVELMDFSALSSVIAARPPLFLAPELQRYRLNYVAAGLVVYSTFRSSLNVIPTPPLFHSITR